MSAAVVAEARDMQQQQQQQQQRSRTGPMAPSQDVEQQFRQLGCEDLADGYGDAGSSSTRVDRLDRLLEHCSRRDDRHSISLHAADTIVMSALRRQFPPSPSNSTGFSFFASLKLERRTTASCSLSIINLFDATQRSCSVSLLLDTETGQLSYSSGTRHARLQFPKAVLAVGRWSHLCLIHYMPSVDSHASRVRLFVDGTLVHQYDNVPWPSLPPPSSLVRAVLGGANGTHTAEENKDDVLVSVGTSYLYDGAIASDVPLVSSELASSGYDGNFQDALGRFMTYSTSTRINLRLEVISKSLAAAGSNHSPEVLSKKALVRIVTDRASSLFAEDHFYFALNPANADSGKLAVPQSSAAQADRDTEEVNDQTQLPHSKQRAKLILNQATPMTRDAIETSYGYAKMIGKPVRRLVERFPDTVWRLGGFTLLLQLVERSSNAVELTKSLAIFLQSVQSSWRLSEEVEMSKGYELLNYLLYQKVHYISVGLLDTLSQAVGIPDRGNEASDLEAALLNPFLFRSVVLDFRIWSKTSFDVQTTHLEVINILLRTSRHRRFNSRRIARMQLSRKLLQRLSSLGTRTATTGVSLTKEQGAMLAIELIATIRASLIATFNDVAIRAVTSFLAINLCTTPSALQQRRQASEEDVANRDGDEAADALQVEPEQLALMVFEMLAELLLERPNFLRKFGSVINARWLRIFVSLTFNPRASRIALDLMAALVSDKTSYAEQRAATTTERRMRLWYENLRQGEESRTARTRRDAIESDEYSAHRWHTRMLPDLQRERAVLGPAAEAQERAFELDPIEGPLRMRSKVKEFRPLWSEYGKRPTEATIQAAKSLPVSELTSEAAHDAEDSTATTPKAEEQDLEEEAIAFDVSGTTNDRREASDGATPVEEASGMSRDDGGAELDSHDEKYRRIVRSLDKGDVIEGVENSLRVVFIEYRASLLIFGKRSFYIIDDYFQRPDGELCNVWEAPEEERDSVVMSTLSNASQGGSNSQGKDSAAAMTLVQQIEGDHHRTRKWKWSDLRLITAKTFLHRKTAIEISFSDGQTCLLVLADSAKASAVFNALASRNRGAANAFQNLCSGVQISGSEERGSNSGQRHSSGGNFARFADAMLGRKGMGAITQRWVDRKISNFDYLMCLNIASGRTYQDITQYPVMPFILRDYASQELDLNDANTFRDLSKPMGAQKESRMKQFQERYQQLVEMYESEGGDAAKPFHYGTHYSTAATVSGFLIRLRPFDKIVRALQGGTFDLPDRTFSSIGQAFHSAAEGSMGDVRELIPEAFYLPDLFLNKNKFSFGTTQAGQEVNDVQLPPWAKGDARLFVKLHRDALESDYVSAHLHEWIDLIFGYKQRGEAAVKAVNCFHELSYSDKNLDLQAIESTMERQAVLKTIHMFGVCPGQLFAVEHPARQAPSSMLGQPLRELSVARTPWLLVQSVAPLRTLKHSGVHFIYPHGQLVKTYVSPKDYLILPSLGLSLSLGHLDGSVRFYARDNMNQVKAVAEDVLSERASCLADASGSTPTMLGGQADGGGGTTTEKNSTRILIGGVYGSLIACQVDVSKGYNISVLYACRGHRGSILSIHHSHPWSLTVSGSADGTAIIWDDRGTYVQTLPHHGPVHHVRTSDSEGGYIATASGMTLCVWSVNGDAIASIDTGGPHDKISSLAFYEGGIQGLRYEDDERSLCIVFTGHRGKIIGWRCVPDHERAAVAGDAKRKQWRLEPFHVSEHFDRFDAGTLSANDNDGAAVMSATPPLITSLRFQGDVLFSGDEHGRLYAWCLPGQSIEVANVAGLSGQCLNCQKKFGVFEKRVQCASCGGLHCAVCTYTLAGSPFGPHKYCIFCRDHLSTLVSRTPQARSPSL